MYLSPTEILGLRRTNRWHTRDHGRLQTVAEHSATTALLARWLAPEDLPERDRADLLELCLVHDAHEPRFGDTPYPARQALMAMGIDIDEVCMGAFWGSRGLPTKGVSPLVQALADAADSLDAALYSRDWLPAIFPETAAKAMDKASCLPEESQEKVRSALYGAVARQVTA